VKKSLWSINEERTDACYRSDRSPSTLYNKLMSIDIDDGADRKYVLGNHSIIVKPSHSLTSNNCPQDYNLLYGGTYIDICTTQSVDDVYYGHREYHAKNCIGGILYGSPAT
jgi:hypothetical protein